MSNEIMGNYGKQAGPGCVAVLRCQMLEIGFRKGENYFEHLIIKLGKPYPALFLE